VRKKDYLSRQPIRFIRRLTAVAFSCLFSGALFLSSISSSASPNGLPVSNIDSHLQRLAERVKNTAAPQTNLAPHGLATPATQVDVREFPGRFDSTGRVLVHIHLDGTQTMEAVERSLASFRISVLDKNASYRNGLMAAYLTPEEVETVARLAGIRAITMEGKPHTNVGAVTSEGTVVLKTNQVNKLGIKGDGITVGVLSDSFNTAQLNVSSPPATTAADDVRTGDLPVVNVLQDYDAGGLGGTDEGRAICQIVFDLAPHCNLAFATAYVSEVGFANNIIALRTQANCDVIVDDVSYSDDPVFSDGLLAFAVNTVASSANLPGHPAVYCSAAGNEGDNGYISPDREISDNAVRAPGRHGNLKLEQVARAMTAGGWHNWNPVGGFEPSTAISVPGDPSLTYNLFLQWDDVFDQNHGITTSYNILVFDQDGNYLSDLSGTSDAFSIQEPYQQTGNLTLGTNYQIAIAKGTKKDPLAPKPPTIHQIAVNTFLDGLGNLTGKYFHASPLNVQTTYGHPAANGAIDVAAYVYDWTDKKTYVPVIEPYTSPGPVFIYFDALGERLVNPELRYKPEVAGVDGTGTTFFPPGSPYQADQFAFFGTSAAVAHVAGVSALIIQAAGGPGSIDPATVKLALEGTTPARDIDPLFAGGLSASRSGFLSVSAQGSCTDGPNYLTINYIGIPGQSLISLTIDATKGDLIFDPSAQNPSPTLGAVVGIDPSAISLETTKVSPKLTLRFTKGAFVSGATVSFTVDQDNAITKVSGGQSDYLSYGTTFTATFDGLFKDTIVGSFQNQIGEGWNRADGYGLVDALAAVRAIQPSSPRVHSQAQNPVNPLDLPISITNYTRPVRNVVAAPR
jgi:hypothetical protein